MSSLMDGLKRAIEHFGSAKLLAAAIDVKPATLSQWVSSVRPLPMSRCLEIERATKGAVKCEDLRPDIDWTRVSEPEKAAA